MSNKLDYLRIKEKRNELDITQKQLAEDLEINLNSYKSLETGRTLLDKKTLNRICEYLHIDLDNVYKENIKDTKVISIMSNKGGVGKTSVSGSLAYALSELGYNILCIDADMQGNLTHSFNLETDNRINLAEAIVEELDLSKFIIRSTYENIDFIVYNTSLSAIEMIMFTKNAREHILKRILTNTIQKGIYDYIIIDTNPALSILNFNVINITDYCITPVQLGAFGLEGLDILMNFINDAKKYNANFKKYKLIINNYDLRKGITKKLEEWLHENYPDDLFETRIRIDTSIENAQVDNIPVLMFNSNSRISKDFRTFAKEFIKTFK